jgi:hypothetical protein
MADLLKKASGILDSSQLAIQNVTGECESELDQRQDQYGQGTVERWSTTNSSIPTSN